MSCTAISPTCEVRGGVGAVPLEHRALDLATSDGLLDEHLRVVLAGGLDGGLEIGALIDLRDAHGRPSPSRLDEDGVAEAVARRHRGRAVGAPRAVGDDGIRPDGDAVTGEDDLHVVLVHAGRGGEHPKPT